MPFSPLPKIITDKITDITPELLQSRGITLLMMDFDNTIVPYHVNDPEPEILHWFDTMRQAGITLCIVSNTKKPRLPAFSEKYGMEYILHARKPFTPGIRECLARYGVKPENAALVGDQIYTDTLGANAAGVTSILVKAINNHNFWLKARHVLEKPFIYAARNRRI